MYVVVQFYPWYWISYITISQNKNKKKNWITPRIKLNHDIYVRKLNWFDIVTNYVINSSSISIFIIFSKLESFHWYQFTEKIRWSTPSIGTPTIRLRRFSFYITWQIKWPPSPRAFSVRLFLTSTKDNRRELSLARSLPDFARTTDQERTPRD